jgi:hypothetical protein
MLNMLSLLNLLACQTFFNDTIDLKTSLPTVKANSKWPLGMMIQISSEGLYSDESLIVPIKDWEVEGRYRTGLTIQPLFDHLENEMAKAKILGDANGLEPFDNLLVAADPNTPFKMIRDVLYSSGQAGFGQFGFIVNDSLEDIPSLVPYSPPFKPNKNTAPKLEGAQLSSPKVRVGEVVSCEPTTVVDQEEDQVSFIAEWTVNGTKIHNGLMIKPERVGDHIQCSLVATDGMDVSESKQSEVVQVLEKLEDDKSHWMLLHNTVESLYPNCVDEIRLTIDEYATLDLPVSTEETDLNVRKIGDTKRFQEWNEQFHRRSVAGHKRLIVFQRLDTKLETFLTFSSLWLRQEASELYPVGGMKLSEQLFRPTLEKSVPSELTVQKGEVPVVEIKLPIIRMPHDGAPSMTCVGKDGKRYPNSKQWMCRILEDQSISCGLPLVLEQRID